MPLIMFVSSSFNTYVNLPKKKDFSTIVAPVTEIVKKSIGFKWNDERIRLLIC
jgi:hypothetical protein